MKVLLDTCVAASVKAEMQAAGHDVVWTGEWPTDPGDQAILDSAYKEERILVTIDKDFGERAIVLGEPHHGIVRLVNLSAKMQASVCLQVLELHGEELQKGAIVTAYADHLRVRPPEKDE